VDRDGKEEKIQVSTQMYYFPEISPDGNKIALTVDNNGKGLST
jgi:Tol biopolymer transport system component